MNKVFEKLTSHLVKNPKIVFLIDSLGALLTVLFLLVILRNFSGCFGMPKTALSFLWPIAASFCLYSASCFLFLKGKWTLFIRIISFANLIYCLLILMLLFTHYYKLTALGFTYFLAETAIVCILVYIELNVSAKILNSLRNRSNFYKNN